MNGNTKQLVIIHGWTYNLDKWTETLSVLKSQGYDPIMLKVPGLTEPSEKVWDIDGYVEWLSEKIKNYEKPIIIGHSNGGRIAMSFIQKYPDKLDKLILIDSAGILNNYTIPKLKLKALKVISKIGKIFSYIPIVKKVFYKLIGAQDYLNAAPNMKVTMQNMLLADKLIDPAKILVPTIIIWGRGDKITPLRDGKKLNSLINESKLYVIDDARHSPFYTNTQEVVKIITDFIKG
jgi:pimeloyl-ACP methyl ester carboxylesterase